MALFKPHFYPTYRKHVLKERMEKYKIYENFLLETANCLPSSEFKAEPLPDSVQFTLLSYIPKLRWNKIVESFPVFHNNGPESLVLSVIRRHETLFVTYQELQKRLGHMEVKMAQDQQQLQSMKQEQSIKNLVSDTLKCNIIFNITVLQ